MVEHSLGKRKAPGSSPGVSETVIFGETVSLTLAETPNALGVTLASRQEHSNLLGFRRRKQGLLIKGPGKKNQILVRVVGVQHGV